MPVEQVHINRAYSGGGGAWYDDMIGVNFPYVQTLTDPDTGKEWFEIDVTSYRGNPNAIDLPAGTRLFALADDSIKTPPI